MKIKQKNKKREKHKSPTLKKLILGEATQRPSYKAIETPMHHQ